MSFTAEVKDELSRSEPACPLCNRAMLSAIVHIEGTLNISGSGRYRLEIATETPAVARTVVRLLHTEFNLKTEVTTRRSVLHKTYNYLITVPGQPRLAKALEELGIIDPDSRSIVAGIDERFAERECCAAAYLRGAFLGSGFVSDPRGDFHFEMTTESEVLAHDLAALMEQHGIKARTMKRRNVYTTYLKGAERIVTFLALAGAHRSVLTMENARVVKSVRNDVNRTVNAEVANSRKASNAAYSQIRDIKLIADRAGLDSLPPALRSFAQLRLAHPEVSLRELGELADPPLSKSAVYHRVRRLEALADSYRDR
ncbi:MAG: DNA-binding protein WhiA [Actinomycetota bacterium]|jgi:DNA-binding protein WhiA|nr:DNA-binding protein WhiA [Actinomycetota bacterium]